MKLRKPALSLFLTLLTVTTLPFFTEGTVSPFEGRRAIAQTSGEPQTKVQVAANEFSAALTEIGSNGFSVPEATALMQMGQRDLFRQGIEIYRQKLEQRGQTLATEVESYQQRYQQPGQVSSELMQILLGKVSSNDLIAGVQKIDEIEGIAYAMLKLAVLSDAVGFSDLSDKALTNVVAMMRQVTDQLTTFSYREVNGIPLGSSSVVSFHNAINLYVPHFNLLQRVYAAQAKLISQGGNPTELQALHYQSLLASEAIRTLSVDQSVATQRTSGNGGDRLTRFARAFSERVTVDDIKKVVQSENATVVTYSIVSELDNPYALMRQANGGADSGGSSTSTQSPQRRSSPDRLFIWVIKPTGEISFVERSIPANLVRNLPGGSDFLGSDQCERDTSDECRGQSSTAIAQLVRLTRSAIRVRVRGQQEAAISSSAERSNAPDSRATGNLSTDPLGQQDKALKELHQLLIEPIQHRLPTDEESRVIFMPQGSLSFVPFAALKDSAGRYLIEKHTIQTAPNFRTLILANANRQQQSNRNRNVLIVGDPTMPRSQENEGTSSLELDALPSARKEAKAVDALFRQRRYNTDLLIGSEATEAKVRSQMRDARIIHLATHGILDAEPETPRSTPSQGNASSNISSIWSAISWGFSNTARPSGSVALAASGEHEKSNGFLTSAEIFQMDLKADLVVLSACNTGRGPLTPGGVVGLPFSLSIAGVPSTVVSLWAVGDDSTAKLMTQFYESYLTRNSGNKAKALREAMLYMIENGYRDRPVDWAAFTLVGTSN